LSEKSWEEAEEAERVFKQNNIRIDSTKNISQIAVENGVVIGALASGWSTSQEYGEKVAIFAFDLVVKAEFRRQGVGLKLIQNAIAKYNSEKHEYEEKGHKTMMRIWVINPILVPVLEGLGFTVEATYKNGSAYLIAY
jgi:GNAT superfamily N-acetyltransferase